MLHFLDSGAHSLINKAFKKKVRKIPYSWYRTQEFWDYVDSYAAYVKKYKKYIDWYANVDVIRAPNLTWKVQQYLEKEHGLNPVPVVHYGAHLKHLDRYLERDYEYIALGGPPRRQGDIYHLWADAMFNSICQTPRHLPVCKVHGFAVTTHALICRYPWYSVDSVTWKKMSYYGQVLVPRCQEGRFRFDIPNMVLFVDPTSKYTDRRKGAGRHFWHLDKITQRGVLDWLDYIEIPFGKRGKDGSIIKMGVSNHIPTRVAATVKYFLHLEASRPKWPWPFHKPTYTNMEHL